MCKQYHLLFSILSSVFCFLVAGKANIPAGHTLLDTIPIGYKFLLLALYLFVLCVRPPHHPNITGMVDRALKSSTCLSGDTLLTSPSCPSDGFSPEPGPNRGSALRASLSSKNSFQVWFIQTLSFAPISQALFQHEMTFATNRNQTFLDPVRTDTILLVRPF